MVATFLTTDRITFEPALKSTGRVAMPTMAEASGLPRYDSAIWYGLLAPAGTPRDVIDKISGAVNEALKADDTLSQMRKQGMDPSGGGPAAFASYIEADTKKWAEVINALDLKK